MKTTNKVSSLIALAALMIGQSVSAEPSHKYMGVGSCSSSNCHGSATGRNGTNVAQNEYYVWMKHDKHSKAYAVLLEEDSRRIASHLGIKAAHEDPLCLACHATYVPEKNLHGEKFSVEDGVSCESCHGPAENWIQSHATRGAQHKDNVERGLHDLVPTEARGKLCLSCHYGTDEKTVDHRLYGAGHPRLTFELDTYGALEPAHWVVDKDYIERKGPYSPVQTWISGQLLHAEAAIAAITSPKRSKSGQFPELSLFDCNSCHHDLTHDQWKKRDYNGRPGELHLNLPALTIVREILLGIGDENTIAFSKSLASLHDNYKFDGGADPIPALKKLLGGQTKARLLRAALQETAQQRVIGQLIKFCSNTRFLKYEVAEQVVMGVQALLAEKATDPNVVNPRLQRLYDALKNDEAFDPDAFTKQCKEFGR